MKNYLDVLKELPVKDRGERMGGRYTRTANRLYSIQDRSVTVLVYFFSNDPDKPQGFHGATSYTMTPVFQSEIDERRECADDERWRQAVACGQTDLGLDDWWEECCNEADNEGLFYPYDDDSYRAEFNAILSHASKSDLQAIKENILDPAEEDGEKIVGWTCVSCGRGSQKYDDEVSYWFDTNLLKLVKLYEGK